MQGEAVLHGLSGMLPYKRIIGSLFADKPYIFLVTNSKEIRL